MLTRGLRKLPFELAALGYCTGTQKRITAKAASGAVAPELASGCETRGGASCFPVSPATKSSPPQGVCNDEFVLWKKLIGNANHFLIGT